MMMQGIVVVCYTFAVDDGAAVILAVSEIKIEISAEVAAVSWNTASSILLAQKKADFVPKRFLQHEKGKKISAHKSTVFIQSQETSNDNTAKRIMKKSILIM